MKITKALFLILCVSIFACQSQTGEKTDLTAEEFRQKIEETDGEVILDVRTPGEYEEGYIAGAENVDYNSSVFKHRVKQLDKDKTYFVYCLSGGRSSSAAEYMRDQGFTNVYELDGGMMAWRRDNLPVEEPESAAVSTDKVSMDAYKEITTSADVVLIDFFAPWCVPCKQMEPMLEEVGKEYEGKVKIVRIDIDQSPELTSQLGIQAIPLFKVFKNGSETWNHQGTVAKEELVKQL